MIWYEIPGFQGYRINLQAEVMSTKFNEPRIMKVWPDDKNMHWRLMLRRNGQYVTVGVHVLMALVFLGPCPEGMQVCHNNGDGFDNRITNLRYDIPSNNNLDQVRHGTHSEASRDCCDQGHEFTPENTMRRKGRNGNEIRKCKECHRITMARYRARRKAGLTPTPERPRTTSPKPQTEAEWDAYQGS